MSDDNPYRSPVTVSSTTAKKAVQLSLGQKVFVAILIVLTIPATLIAFYMTCMGAGWGSAMVLEPIMRNAGSGDYAFALPAIGIGIVAGSIAGILTAYGMYRWIQSVGQLPKKIESSDTQEPRT